MTDNFHNNPVFSEDLPDFETLELIPVSLKYLKVIMFNMMVISMIILAGTMGGNLFVMKEFTVSMGVSLAFILLFIVLLFVYQYFAFFQRKYAVREKDIIYQFGLLKRNIIIIPYNRIQHSALEEGWISRSLGLKSVSFYTAGSRGADLQINGLPKDVAERLNQLVISKIEAEESENELHNETLENSSENDLKTENQNGE